jgi:hypothetical protein
MAFDTKTRRVTGSGFSVPSARLGLPLCTTGFQAVAKTHDFDGLEVHRTTKNHSLSDIFNSPVSEGGRRINSR